MVATRRREDWTVVMRLLDVVMRAISLDEAETDVTSLSLSVSVCPPPKKNRKIAGLQEEKEREHIMIDIMVVVANFWRDAICPSSVFGEQR